MTDHGPPMLIPRHGSKWLGPDHLRTDARPRWLQPERARNHLVTPGDIDVAVRHAAVESRVGRQTATVQAP